MYIKLVEDLVSKDTPVGSETVTAGDQTSQTSTHVITKVIDNVHLIKLNRPEKKNALVLEVKFVFAHIAACTDMCRLHAKYRGCYFVIGDTLSTGGDTLYLVIL